MKWVERRLRKSPLQPKPLGSADAAGQGHLLDQRVSVRKITLPAVGRSGLLVWCTTCLPRGGIQNPPEASSKHNQSHARA